MKSMLKAICAIVIVICLIAGTSYFRLTTYAQQGAKYRDFTAISYYKFGFMPNAIVYDIRSIGDESSTASIMGGFFEFAEALKGRRFDHVELAYKGKVKFILPGRHFQKIGDENDWQNPIYALRTFPENLRTPEGRSAFQTWTGGVLGVTNAQMEDLNKMAEQWWLRDYIADL